MLYYLHELSESIFGPFRIFESIPFRATMAFLTCFVLSLLLGERVIRRLISLKVGQPIRTEAEVHKLHELHGGKAGTPTMGGIMILGTTLLSTILWCKPLNPFIHALVGIMLLTGAIGFVDDYIKVKRRKSDGMSARFKLLAQVGSAALVGAFLAYHPDVGSFIRQLYIPFFDEPILVDMGVLAIPLFVLVIVGASNAVNLTDGLDGLAAGCTITSVGSFGVLAYMGATSLIASICRYQRVRCLVRSLYFVQVWSVRPLDSCGSTVIRREYLWVIPVRWQSVVRLALSRLLPARNFFSSLSAVCL